MSARYKRTVLATCCLPWREDWSLDEGIFRKSIRHLVGAGLPDLYVFGTAGEGHAVSDDDFRRVVEIFTEEMMAAGGTPMGGIITLSLRTIFDRIAFAAGLGVHGFLFCRPPWGPLNDGERRRCVAEVCGSCPDCPVLV
jgi:dihydrodipicolinate synthase/N-acetylneuraminate lyase